MKRLICFIVLLATLGSAAALATTQTITGGMWSEFRSDETANLLTGTSTYQMNATGELVALVMRVPKTGTITRFETNIAQVNNAFDNGLRFSFQDVSTSTGLPDGVVDQFATIASGSQTTGWANPGDFDSSRAVTKGDLIALVIDNPTFTSSDDIRIASIVMASSVQFPYGINVTSTKVSGDLPVVALRYDDGTYPQIAPELHGVNLLTKADFQSDTDPDEVGMAFRYPAPVTLNGISFHGITTSAGNSYDIVVYDGDGTSVLDTQTIDGDIVQAAAGPGYYTQLLSAPVSLAANTTYRVVIKAGSSTINTSVYYYTFNSATLMDTIEGGQAFYMTQRVDAGTWKDFNNGTDGYRHPELSLIVTGADDGTNGTVSQVTNGGFWLPTRTDENTTGINATVYRIDLSGEIAAMVVRAPKAGNLTRCEAYINTVTNAPDNGLRFSFQDVSTSTGLPDGVVDQSATIAMGSVTAGWGNPGDFDMARTVTRGEVVACVVDIPTFTSMDDVGMGGYNTSSTSGFPYGVSATNTKNGTTLMPVGLRYDDGTYAYVAAELRTATAITSRSYQNDTTPDEFGVAFSLPFKTTLAGFSAHLRFNSANNSADAVVYDGAGMAQVTDTLDGDVTSSVTSARWYNHYFSTPVTIAPNTTYRLVFKAGSSTLSTEVWYDQLNAVSLMETSEAGQLFYGTQRTDAGAWTDYNSGTFLRPHISLYFTGLNVPAGGHINMLLTGVGE